MYIDIEDILPRTALL